MKLKPRIQALDKSLTQSQSMQHVSITSVNFILIEKRTKKEVIAVQETPLTSDQQLTVECFFVPARRALNFDIDGSSNSLVKERSSNADTSLAEPICISDGESEMLIPGAVAEAVETSSAAQCSSASRVSSIQCAGKDEKSTSCIQWQNQQSSVDQWQNQQSSVDQSDAKYCQPSVEDIASSENGSELSLQFCHSMVENSSLGRLTEL